MNRFPVEEGTLALLSREQLLHHRIVDDADHQLPINGERYRDATVRKAVDEVERAVDWVDDPGGIICEDVRTAGLFAYESATGRDWRICEMRFQPIL